MKYFQLLVLLFTLGGCTASVDKPIPSIVESNVEPVIEFVAKTDMRKWDKHAKDVRWGIAVSESNITSVVKDGWSYNEPTYDIHEYERYIVRSGIKSFQRVTIPVSPGVYDWIILLDLDNNGSWDSYLGSVQEHIQLNQIEFQYGFIYSVVVGEDSIPKLEIKPNKSSKKDALKRASS